MLNRADANEIQKAFGTCTVLNECYTIDEILEDASEFATLTEWLDCRLSVEDISLDRAGVSDESFNTVMGRLRRAANAFLCARNCAPVQYGAWRDSL